MTVPTADPGPGSPLPGITLERLLHRGSRGVVWRGRQHTPSRPVIVKIPTHPTLLRREARALARLDHPAIPTLLEATEGNADLPGHLVIEHRRGTPLSSLVGDTSVARAVAIADALFDALAHAHAVGVVHGDPKPEHVLVDDDGELALIDFGEGVLAPRDGDSPATPGGEREEDLEPARTPLYSAPERSGRGGGSRRPTAASDVYAAGLLLHELLTGRNPRAIEPTEGDGAENASFAADEIPPPSRWRDGVGKDLDTIVLACVSPEAPDRPDAAAVRDDLRRIARGEPITLRPVSMLRRTRAFLARRALLRRSLIAWLVVTTVAITGLSIARERARVATEKLDEHARTGHELLAWLLEEAERLHSRAGTIAVRERWLELTTEQLENLAGLPSPTPDLAELHRSLGDLAAELGRPHEALAHFRNSAREWDRFLADRRATLEQRRDHVIPTIRIGDVLKDLSLIDDAERAYLDGHRRLAAIAAEFPHDRGALDDLGYSYERRAALAFARGDIDHARPLVERRHEVAERLVREHPCELSYLSLFQAHAMLGRLAHESADFEADEEHVERQVEVSAMLRDLDPGKRDYTHRSISVRNALLASRLRWDEPAVILADSEPLLEEALAYADLDAHRWDVQFLVRAIRGTRIEALQRLGDDARTVREIDRLLAELDTWRTRLGLDDLNRWRIGETLTSLGRHLRETKGGASRGAELCREGIRSMEAAVEGSADSVLRRIALARTHLVEPPGIGTVEHALHHAERALELSGGTNSHALEVHAAALEALGEEEAARVARKRWLRSLAPAAAGGAAAEDEDPDPAEPRGREPDGEDAPDAPRS